MDIVKKIRDNGVSDTVGEYRQDINITTLLLGAVAGAFAGIILSALIGPTLTGAIAHELNDQGLPPYETPELGISMQGGSGYTVKGEDLERFNGTRYNNSVRLYEIRISNRGDRPIEKVELDMPLPGCVITYDKTTLGTGVAVDDYVFLDLRGQSEGLDIYSCSQTVRINRLYPGDEVRIRYLLAVEFDECDLLQGVGKENVLSYDYYWQKNGIRFYESGKIGMGFQQDFLNAYDFKNKSIVVGDTVQADGINYTNIIVGRDTNSIPKAMGECRLANG